MTIWSRVGAKLAFAAAATVLGGAGCSSSSTPISDDITLMCPTPGELPFRTQSHGFQQSTNASLVVTDTRFKDTASDALGNPGGVQANIYIADTAMPDASAVAYQGVKARTTPTGGLSAFPLPDENVSLWFYDGSDWQTEGRTQTGSDGSYALASTNFTTPNAEPLYSILEADGTCAAHYNYLWPAGQKVIVVDIDGTLTIADSELVMELSDESYVPKAMTAAVAMTQAWATKGYPIVYLTARPHLFRPETRSWLDQLDFPLGPVITANNGGDPTAYKTLWLQRMVTDFGWVPYAAYGNEDTDIAAYENVSIPLTNVFIIGPSGGDMGTVAIPNMDYTQHIATFIDAQPDNN